MFVDRTQLSLFFIDLVKQRIILALEDSIFVNVHKNPTNTKDIAELEKEIVSMTKEEYNNKYK